MPASSYFTLDIRQWFTPCCDTNTTMEGGERCVFFSWKYSHHFELVSAKDENIKVHCAHSVLVTKYYQASTT